MATKAVYAVLKRSRRPGRQRWYFVLHSAGNGESIATSEMYRDRQDAIDTATLVTRDVRGG